MRRSSGSCSVAHEPKMSPSIPLGCTSILHEFEIVPKTVWKPGLRRGIRGTAASGYKREWFEQVWASYCPANAPTRQRTPLMIDTDFKMNAAAADTTIQPFKSLA